MKGLYDISVLFKIFKRFEKVVLTWKNEAKWGKNGQKWAKMAAPESANIHYSESSSNGDLLHTDKV